MLSYPEIDPIIFSIGPLAIRWYGLMYVLGFVVCWMLARKRSEQGWSIVKPEQVDDLIFYGMLGVIVGGRLNQIGTQSNSGLPVDVSEEIDAAGALACDSLDMVLPLLDRLSDG